jgi:hypothetical protein
MGSCVSPKHGRRIKLHQAHGTLADRATSLGARTTTSSEICETGGEQTGMKIYPAHPAANIYH